MKKIVEIRVYTVLQCTVYSGSKVHKPLPSLHTSGSTAFLKSIHFSQRPHPNFCRTDLCVLLLAAQHYRRLYTMCRNGAPARTHCLQRLRTLPHREFCRLPQLTRYCFNGSQGTSKQLTRYCVGFHEVLRSRS